VAWMNQLSIHNFLLQIVIRISIQILKSYDNDLAHPQQSGSCVESRTKENRCKIGWNQMWNSVILDNSTWSWLKILVRFCLGRFRLNYIKTTNPNFLFFQILSQLTTFSSSIITLFSFLPTLRCFPLAMFCFLLYLFYV
jgi:hypothetical protein